METNKDVYICDANIILFPEEQQVPTTLQIRFSALKDATLLKGLRRITV